MGAILRIKPKKEEEEMKRGEDETGLPNDGTSAGIGKRQVDCYRANRRSLNSTRW